MVCLACLLPLFFIPIVNILPILFDRLMAKIYQLFGWEHRKPERAPPACPYKASVSKKTITGVNGESESSAKDLNPKSVEAENRKSD